MLDNLPVPLVLLLSALTLGVFIPIWFLRARSILAPLRTTARMPRYLPYGLLALHVTALAAAMVLAVSISVSEEWIGRLDSLVLCLLVVSDAFMAVKVVEILHEYSGDELTTGFATSVARMTFLHVFALQYEMNRLPFSVDGKCPTLFKNPKNPKRLCEMRPRKEHGL